MQKNANRKLPSHPQGPRLGVALISAAIVLGTMTHETLAQAGGGANPQAAACDHTTHSHGCTDPTDTEAIARELQNPAGSLASLTFKNQIRWYQGDLPGADDESNYTLLFQPTFPFPIGTTASGGKQNLFIRPAFPMQFDQPTFGPSGFKDVTAFGDIGFDIAYGVTQPNGFIFLGGLVGTLPTATDNRVSGRQFRLGPEAFIGQSTDWGLIGIFPQHQWNVTGWSDSQHSTSEVQVIFNVNLGEGLVLSSQPMIFYDWVDNQWTVPVNAQVAKTVVVGSIPVRFQLELDYFVEGPDAFREEWLLGINITPVVPNFINNWIRGL